MTRMSRVLRRRLGRGGSERGAVMVEFALALPILLMITFGIIEFSSAYHDKSTVTSATRAGGRVGSAQATNPDFGKNTADAVSSALKSLPSDAPQELWIYKAPNDGNPPSTCASNCIKYRWSQSQRAFDTSAPGGGGWSASSHQVCHEPFDQIGVYVKIDHSYVTKLFGSKVTLTDHAVFRFEPVPTSVCS
jgi:hypothetical protein